MVNIQTIINEKLYLNSKYQLHVHNIFVLIFQALHNLKFRIVILIFNYGQSFLIIRNRQFLLKHFMYFQIIKYFKALYLYELYQNFLNNLMLTQFHK